MNWILADPLPVVALIVALGINFACGFASGRLSTKYRR